MLVVGRFAVKITAEWQVASERKAFHIALHRGGQHKLAVYLHCAARTRVTARLRLPLCDLYRLFCLINVMKRTRSDNKKSGIQWDEAKYVVLVHVVVGFERCAFISISALLLRTAVWKRMTRSNLKSTLERSTSRRLRTMDRWRRSLVAVSPYVSLLTALMYLDNTRGQSTCR